VSALWLQLRTSVARWGFAPLLVLGLAILFGRSRFWIGIWPETGAAAQISAFFVSVFAAGLAAWVAAAVELRGLHEQEAAAAIRPVTIELTRFAAALSWLVAPYLLVAAVAFVTTAATGRRLRAVRLHAWLEWRLAGGGGLGVDSHRRGEGTPPLCRIVLIAVGWGAYATVVPAATDSGGANVEFWRLLGVGSGTLPVLTLASPMHALEAAGGAAYHRLRGWVLGGAYSWIPPWVAVCAILYWGHGASGGYRWWEFTVQPAGHLPSLLLAVGLCVAGLAAYALTPWRIRHLAGTVASNP